MYMKIVKEYPIYRGIRRVKAALRILEAYEKISAEMKSDKYRGLQGLLGEKVKWNTLMLQMK